MQLDTKAKISLSIHEGTCGILIDSNEHRDSYKLSLKLSCPKLVSEILFVPIKSETCYFDMNVKMVYL